MQELETASVGQLQVDQGEVRRALAEGRARLAQARRALDGKPLRPYQLAQGGLEAGVVVDEEDARHGYL